MKRLRGENGVELLEFALVIPIFVFVLYGLIAFGIMLSAKQSITHAAAEGARAAVGAAPGTEAQVAKARVHQALADSLGGNYDDSMTTATVATCQNSSQQCITVKIVY